MAPNSTQKHRSPKSKETLAESDTCGKAPRPVDVHVGTRIKQRRLYLAWSQEDLAVRLGLTFQQIQKYEKGKNRVSASMLFALSQVLQVRIGWFFEEFEECSLASLQPINSDSDLMEDSPRELGELTRASHALSPRRRRALLHLAEELGIEYALRLGGPRPENAHR